ncbi:MAG TPA: hypothetical protein VFH94_10275 [Streptomyces sp.]|nr:hypothetical protein [Streptomyces sp.]
MTPDQHSPRHRRPHPGQTDAPPRANQSLTAAAPALRSPCLLLIATAVLAVTGLVLLAGPHHPGAPAPPPPTPSAAPTTPPTSPSSKPALPPYGEGVAGDRAIQQSLERSWPADLPARDAHELLTAGRDLLRADATGHGRATWSSVFGDPDLAIAPPFAASRFRIQAAIARRDGRDDRAVVHLVWAGADRGGAYSDGRITDLHFIRMPSTEGASPWTPQPRI